MATFRVEFYRRHDSYTTIEVEAVTPDEAKVKAQAVINTDADALEWSDPNEDEPNEPQFVEVTRVKPFEEVGE